MFNKTNRLKVQTRLTPKKGKSNTEIVQDNVNETATLILTTVKAIYRSTMGPYH